MYAKRHKEVLVHFQLYRRKRTMRKALALLLSVVMSLSLLVSTAWA